MAMVEQPETTFDRAAEEGYERLRRNRLDLVITASIAGIEVLFGAVAAATVIGYLTPVIGRDASTVIGAVVFPLGFMLVLLGRSELFTENFLIPTTRVLQSGIDKEYVGLLVRLWGFSLIFNLAGALFGSFLLTRPEVLPQPTIDYLHYIARFETDHGFWMSCFSAVQAGILMTLLTWLMISVQEIRAKISVIFAIGFVIEIHHFNHVIVSAGQIFIAMWSGSPVSPSQWFLYSFVPAVLGNTIGGVGLVTGLRSLQVWTKKREPETD